MSIPAMGLKLGGGAAVGAGLMLLVWKLTIPTQPYALIELHPLVPNQTPIKITAFDTQSIDKVAPLRNENRAVVVFKEGQERGWFKTHHLQPDEEDVAITYQVDRSGLIGTPKVEIHSAK